MGSRVFQSLGAPVPGRGIPSTNMWGNLLYAEAVDPDAETSKGLFVVYDVSTGKVVYSGNGDIHTGFRNIMVDRQGNAYFSVKETGLARYSPQTNTVTVLDVTLPGQLRASTRQAADGWFYGATDTPDNKLFRYHPESNKLEELGSAWNYTAHMVLDPTERYVYFMPGAHGQAYKMGTPILQFNVQTRQTKVIAFLNDFYEGKYRYRVGGTYGFDIDPQGKRLFININGQDLASNAKGTANFGDPAVLVVHLPDSETGTVPRMSFKDVAAQVGLQSPTAGAYIHTSSWGDVNNDGWLDLFMGTFVDAKAPVPSKLFLNRNGTFRESGQSTVEVKGRGAGSTLADLDNDGDLDLYLSNNRIDGTTGPSNEPSRLWRNDGGVFVDVTEASGIRAQSTNGRQVAVLDYNKDGLLDLFVIADALRKSGPSVLLKNKGKLVFEDATAAAGLPLDIHGLGLAVADITEDGWPDLFIAGGPSGADANRNYLFLSKGNGTFRKLDTTVFDWTSLAKGGEDWVSGAAFGDLNRDGRLDLVVGHHFGSSVDKGVAVPLRLYMNRGMKNGAPVFEDVTASAGLPPILSKAPHVEVQDFDNDGWPDIYTSVRIDTPEGPAPLIFTNNGVPGDTPKFNSPAMVNPHYYAGGPVADFNRDGRLDIFFPEWRATLGQGPAPSMLMENRGAPGNWLQVRVKQGASNASLGARVSVYKAGMSGNAAGLLGVVEISSAYGFSSSQPGVAHFGLGPETLVDVVVAMPFGGPVVVKNGVPANRRLLMPQGVLEATATGELQATAVTDTSPQFIQERAGLPPHTLATTAPTVDFVLYPKPNYSGNPWSQWGAALLASDGRFYSAIGDHKGQDGNAYLYEYDPVTRKLTLVGDLLTAVKHVPGGFGHGKIHSRITESGGYLYMTSYWGTRKGLTFDQNYQGSVVLVYGIR
ncbi:MAG TPA: CRTAC1 family protein [Dehalococcoidia bacterium]|nr:CRTAC1 family protein [Dehalococcoidia bacterium]